MSDALVAVSLTVGLLVCRASLQVGHGDADGGGAGKAMTRARGMAVGGTAVVVPDMVVAAMQTAVVAMEMVIPGRKEANTSLIMVPGLHTSGEAMTRATQTTTTPTR